MKILMFGWEWPPFNSGGLGTACFGLVRALAKKGVEVTLALPKMEAADQIVVVSQLTKNIIVDRYGINPERIEVVHNGIDAADYSVSQDIPLILKRFKNDGYKTILFVGRFIQGDGSRWEDYVSGSGWQKRYHQLSLSVTDEKIWEEAARWLALGLHNVILLLHVTLNHLEEITKIFPEVPLVKRAMLGEFVGLHGALVYLERKYQK